MDDEELIDLLMGAEDPERCLTTAWLSCCCSAVLHHVGTSVAAPQQITSMRQARVRIPPHAAGLFPNAPLPARTVASRDGARRATEHVARGPPPARHDRGKGVIGGGGTLLQSRRRRIVHPRRDGSGCLDGVGGCGLGGGGRLGVGLNAEEAAHAGAKAIACLCKSGRGRK